MTWGRIGAAVLGILQWAIAIASVAGTLALLGWIFMMVVRKDKPK
jgi:hypothetical protein